MKKAKARKGKRKYRRKTTAVAVIPPAPPVPHEETNNLPVAMNEAQRIIVSGKTPENEIFWRTVRGGKKVPYVQVHYVVDILNRAFGHDWDDEYTYETDAKTAVELGQVLVHCKLSVRIGGKVVVKHASGGADVDLYSSGKNKGKIIDLADDFKSAESDALKKAAWKFGIAKDVFRWLGDDGKVQKPAEEESGGDEPRNINEPPVNETADQKRIDGKIKIVKQLWARLMKLMPKTYTEDRWKALWAEYKTAAGKRDFPTYESQIDDMMGGLETDLQTYEQAKGETK